MNLFRRHDRQRVHGCHTIHRLKQLTDAPPAQVLAQHGLDGVVVEQPGGPGFLGQLVGEFDGQGRHGRSSGKVESG